MTILHRSIPAPWLIAVFAVIAAALTMRVSSVLALNNAQEAELLLEYAQAAYTAGDYERAFEYGQKAVECAPDAPDVLVRVSDYAFVLGMSRYEPAEFWHVEAFESGLEYAARARKKAPKDPVVHRAWAEGLLLAHLYEIPVDQEELLKAWKTLPVEKWEEDVYRETALRVISSTPHE